MPASFSEPVEKQIQFEVNTKPHRGEKPALTKSKASRQVEQPDKHSKKYKKKASRKISTIKDTCDCKFCYEDHIIRMRLKITHPYL